MVDGQEEKLNPVLERMYKYLEEKEIALSDADGRMGSGNGRFGKMIKNNTIPKESFIEKFLQTFADCNENWLRKNDGEMLKGINNKGIEGLLPSTNNEQKGVPYYDVDFMGGFDLVFNNQTIQPSFYIDFLPFNDCDCWINVTGKSMGPLIAHGDIVGLKKVDNWQRFLLEGEIYAIITDNGFRTIKMLGAGPDNDHYMLIPYNKSEEYKPQVIPKNVITHIFRVKGNIKKFF